MNCIYIFKCVNTIGSNNSFGNNISINCYAFDFVAIVSCYCERLVFATVCIIAISIISCDCSVFSGCYFKCVANLLESCFDGMNCIYASECINTIIGNNIVCNINISINFYVFDSVAIVSCYCERLVFATVCIIAVFIISCDCSVFTRSYVNCVANLLEGCCDWMTCSIYTGECINTIIGNNVVCNINISINHYVCNSVAIVSCDCVRLVFATVYIIAIFIISCDCSVFTRGYVNCVANLLEGCCDGMTCIYACECINTIIGNNIICNINISINFYAFDFVAIVGCDFETLGFAFDNNDFAFRINSSIFTSWCIDSVSIRFCSKWSNLTPIVIVRIVTYAEYLIFV